jgi:regulator of cell morphogenesis and NO signaling
LEKILAKHSARHADVLLPLAGTFQAMKEELDAHLMKEEMVLFPLIRSLERTPGTEAPQFHCGSVANPIRVMMAEHDSAGQALATMRGLTGAYTPPEDACNTFRAFYFGLEAIERDLHQHIHLENNILFPRALELQSHA